MLPSVDTSQLPDSAMLSWSKFCRRQPRVENAYAIGLSRACHSRLFPTGSQRVKATPERSCASSKYLNLLRLVCCLVNTPFDSLNLTEIHD